MFLAGVEVYLKPYLLPMRFMKEKALPVSPLPLMILGKDPTCVTERSDPLKSSAPLEQPRTCLFTVIMLEILGFLLMVGQNNVVSSET